MTTNLIILVLWLYLILSVIVLFRLIHEYLFVTVLNYFRSKNKKEINIFINIDDVRKE